MGGSTANRSRSASRMRRMSGRNAIGGGRAHSHVFPGWRDLRRRGCHDRFGMWRLGELWERGERRMAVLRQLELLSEEIFRLGFACEVFSMVVLFPGFLSAFAPTFAGFPVCLCSSVFAAPALASSGFPSHSASAFASARTAASAPVSARPSLACISTSACATAAAATTFAPSSSSSTLASLF